jgi:hypothetical protein
LIHALDRGRLRENALFAMIIIALNYSTEFLIGSVILALNFVKHAEFEEPAGIFREIKAFESYNITSNQINYFDIIRFLKKRFRGVDHVILA